MFLCFFNSGFFKRHAPEDKDVFSLAHPPLPEDLRESNILTKTILAGSHFKSFYRYEKLEKRENKWKLNKQLYIRIVF